MLEMSIAVIAAAFVVLVGFLIYVLVTTKKTLDQLNKVMKNVEITTVNVNQKLVAMDSLFLAISNVGDKALSSSNKLREDYVTEEVGGLTHQPRSEAQSRLDHLMDWLSLGANIWKVYKKKGGS